MFEQLDATQFDWVLWRSGNMLDVLGIRNRYNDILLNRKLILKHAIGYCKGENLICRPKNNHFAVMFLVNEIMFWTHFTEKEFNAIFTIKEGC